MARMVVVFPAPFGPRKPTTSPAGKVAAGDYIGLSRQGIESVSGELAGAAIGLIEALLRPGNEILTLLRGEGAAAADTRRITEWVAAEHPELTVELHHGGQPLYPYLLSIE